MGHTTMGQNLCQPEFEVPTDQPARLTNKFIPTTNTSITEPATELTCIENCKTSEIIANDSGAIFRRIKEIYMRSIVDELNDDAPEAKNKSFDFHPCDLKEEKNKMVGLGEVY